MNIVLLTIGVLALGGAAEAGGKIRVFLNNSSVPLDVTGIAEGISSRMFGAAGVEVEWHVLKGSRSAVPGEGAVVIDFGGNPPADHPAAMAYALPFEGVHIVVLYDRIKAASRDNPGLRPIILAHVLTHEIAHILQGIARHSGTGVMKARWDINDYFDMARAPLKFTSDDIELIRMGCGRREITRNTR